MLSYIAHLDYDKQIRVEAFHEVAYYSKKRMKMKYPKAKYIVIGAIAQGLDEQAGTFELNQQNQVYYTLHYNKACYAIDGYIDLGEDRYIAVVKSAIRRNVVMVTSLMIAIIALFWMLQMGISKDVFDPNAKTFTPSVEHNVVTDPEHIALPGYDDIRMEAGSDMAYLALWNPEGNPCLFKFSIFKDNEELYESGMIEPGKAVTEVKFAQPIEKGVHDATIKIQTFAIDDPKIELNGGEVRIKLVGLEKAK